MDSKWHHVVSHPSIRRFLEPQVQLSFFRSGCRFLCSFLWGGETGTKKTVRVAKFFWFRQRGCEGVVFPSDCKREFCKQWQFCKQSWFLFCFVICSCQEGYHTVGDLREDGEEVLFHRWRLGSVIPFSYCLSFMWSRSTYPGPNIFAPENGWLEC